MISSASNVFFLQETNNDITFVMTNAIPKNNSYEPKRSKKSSKVRFQSHVLVHESKVTLSCEEKCRAFYSKGNFRDIASDNMKDIIRSSSYKFSNNINYTLRGLERYSRTKIGQLASRNRREYVRLIVHAQSQKQGQEKEPMDDLALCQLSMRLTKMDNVRAIDLGKQDARFLMEELMEEDVVEGVSSTQQVSFCMPRRFTADQRAARVA